jgi:hypothetical protein
MPIPGEMDLENEDWEGAKVAKVDPSNFKPQDLRMRKYLVQKIKSMSAENHELLLKSLYSVSSDEFGQFSNEDLKMVIENLQIELGIIQPYDEALSLIGIAGLISDQVLKTNHLGDIMMDDPNLVDFVDKIVPNISERLSGWVGFFYRIVEAARKSFTQPTAMTPFPKKTLVDPNHGGSVTQSPVPNGNQENL